MSSGFSLETLQAHRDSGNVLFYWQYLADHGDDFAKVMVGVIENNTTTGMLWNRWFQLYAPEALLRKAKERTREALWNRIGNLLECSLHPKNAVITSLPLDMEAT